MSDSLLLAMSSQSESEKESSSDIGARWMSAGVYGGRLVVVGFMVVVQDRKGTNSFCSHDGKIGSATGLRWNVMYSSMLDADNLIR